MPITHVALVGHCGFDSGSLTQFAKQIAPQAQVSRINGQAALDEALAPGTLLLVNRVLDGSFAVGGSGIDLIKNIAEQGEGPAMMLVSNYADAQAQAVEAGALPGFGKSDIGASATRERVMQAIG